MEGNRLIPSPAAFDRETGIQPVRECPVCNGTGIVAVGMDGDAIAPRDIPSVDTSEIYYETCGNCGGSGYLNI